MNWQDFFLLCLIEVGVPKRTSYNLYEANFPKFRVYDEVRTKIWGADEGPVFREYMDWCEGKEMPDWFKERYGGNYHHESQEA